MKTIDFLRCLLKAKDDLLLQREDDRRFYDTRISNLEEMLSLKNLHITKLEKQIDDLSKIQLSFNDISPHKSTGKSVKENATKASSTKSAGPEKHATKEKKKIDNGEKEQSQEKRIKCKYENEGKCKLGRNCRYFHPKDTCQFFSKLGSCPKNNICTLRHPRNICFQLERHGMCERGDSCKFRHPLELLQKNHFLVKGHPQHQPPQRTQQRTEVPQVTYPIHPWMNNQSQWKSLPVMNLMHQNISPVQAPQINPLPLKG